MQSEIEIMKAMGALLWTAAGVLGGLTALVGFLAARRDRPPDLGSVSGSWIAEHRATQERDA